MPYVIINIVEILSKLIRFGGFFMDIAEKLKEHLNVETLFTIRLGGKEFPVAESIVTTWALMAILLVVALILTHNMKLHNISKRQAVAELIVTKLEGIVSGMIGEHGVRYVPYLMTVLLYIGLSNIIGVFDLGLLPLPLKPPTKDLNVTVGLALMSILLIEGAGIRAGGVGGWLKAFLRPIGVMLPFNILELVTRPLSLCMRLFGNILAAFTIMELIKMVFPPVLPAALSLYFDLFDGLLQAYIFVFLTSLFIKEAIEPEEESEKKKKKNKKKAKDLPEEAQAA